jgi:RNA polymerase sigma-70 factor, ECF subfamily
MADSTTPSPNDPTRWVDEHADALYRYARQRVRSGHAAEELVQETFLAALEAKDRFEGRSSDRTWLIAILRRKIVDDYRKRSRERPLPDVDGAETSIQGVFDKHSHWSPKPGRWPRQPEEAAQLPELRAAIRTCIDRLPRGVAEAFCLRELEGLAGESLCKVLGISPTNLWSRLHRARMLMRQCLEANWLLGDRPGGSRDAES